jgi:hypothetical protein
MMSESRAEAEASARFDLLHSFQSKKPDKITRQKLGNHMLNPIFGGISGAKLPIDQYDLGEGAVLRATYAHVMAPFLMAFSPAEPGKHHPAPWSAVKGGLSYDVHIELMIDATGNPEWLIGTQALWWIAALLRFRSSWTLSVPIFADRSFQLIPKASDARVFPFEIGTRGSIREADEIVDLSMDDLLWVAGTWKRAAYLFHRERNFAQAFRAFDHSTTIASPSLGLLTLWGALEHLFAPSKQELRFRVSALIACYLEPSGTGRIQLHKKLLKLYDERSQAAHTANAVEAEAASETFAVMKNVLMRIIADDSVPSRDYLEKLLFGAS